jgi:hypothetical protein
MNKIYLLFSLLFFGSSVFGQLPIITMISDGDCSGGKPNVVEIYAQGTVNFADFSVQIQTNSNTTWGNIENLAALGTVTDAFVYIYRDTDASEFATEFSSVSGVGITGALNYNGDDRVRIVNDATSAIVDQYGVDGTDGSGTPWEYQDGFAKRNNQSTPNAGSFDVSNWTVSTGGLNGLGLCQGGADAFETLIGLGTFLGNNSPAVSATPASLTGFNQFLGTPSPEQTITVGGVNLTGDISLTVANGDYEISETTGTGFGTSITLTQTGGTVNPTTIYIRLNGSAIASPANGDITISSAGATNVNVSLQGDILTPAPTVFATPDTLMNFSHFVGTPSAEQTADIAGDFLTADIIVDATSGYEVSLTQGSGFSSSLTLPQTGGSVASTPVYVRLNGTVANNNQIGGLIVSSTGAAPDTVVLMGEVLDYTPYSIGEVTTNDANLVPDSIGVYVELNGIVHCIDYDGDNGYNFVMIDGNDDGISVFNFADVNGYVVAEGDSITVRGQIDQFNGLTQVFAEEIVLVSSGNATQMPTVVTTLDETTESQLVTIENLTLVNGDANWPTNGNVDVTDGTTVFSFRVENESPLSGASTPNVPFNATGLGRQFDNSGVPYDAGYQLFPCSIDPICDVDVTTTTSEITIEANASGVNYQWVDCDDNFSPIVGETSQTFTATENGNYAVIITDGLCSDTSDCVSISNVGVDAQQLNLSVFPNPVENTLNIVATGSTLKNVNVISVTGKRIAEFDVQGESTLISTRNWKSGVYFVEVSTTNGTKIVKVIK